jgi:hypothetical protein
MSGQPRYYLVKAARDGRLKRLNLEPVAVNDFTGSMS